MRFPQRAGALPLRALNPPCSVPGAELTLPGSAHTIAPPKADPSQLPHPGDLLQSHLPVARALPGHHMCGSWQHNVTLT